MSHLFGNLFLRTGSIATVFVLALSQTAQAHIGHVGDLAGHGHLVGVGLTGAAIALAGYLAIANKKSELSDSEEAVEASSAEGVDSEVGNEVGSEASA
mgnify:CR=1 FL=1